MKKKERKQGGILGKLRVKPVSESEAPPPPRFFPETWRARLQCESADLRDTIKDALEKLAQQVYLARRELRKQEQTGSRNSKDWVTVGAYAANLLCTVPALATEKIIELLIPGDQHTNLAFDLTDSLVDACTAFQYAVSDYPQDFARFACLRADWPTLRRVRDNGKDWQQLVRSIRLGSMLPRKGHFDPQRVAVSRTADCIFEIEQLYRRYDSVPARRLVSLEEYERNKDLQSDPHVWIIRQWEIDILRMKLPPRNRSRKSSRAWWKAVKLRLETKRRRLLDTGLLTKYQQQASAAWKKRWCRAKPDTRAWNSFLTLCNQALERLSDGSVTGEAPKTP